MKIFGLFVTTLFAALVGCSSPTLPDPTDLEANNFTQSDTSGNSVSLADHRGKVVLVQFWATWCGPCRAHTPKVKELWAKYREGDFQIIGVSLDNDLRAWKNYIRDNDLSWLHTADGKYFDNAVARQFDIRATPSFILFGKDGARIGDVIAFGELDAKIQAELAKD